MSVQPLIGVDELGQQGVFSDEYDLCALFPLSLEYHN
jgi:hypothetical protein